MLTRVLLFPGLPNGEMIAGHSFHDNEKRMMIVRPSLNLPLQAKEKTAASTKLAGRIGAQAIGARKVGDRGPHPAVDPVIIVVEAGSR